MRPYAELCADPEVMRWIGDGSTLTFEQSEASIQKFTTQWQTYGFGLFAITSKENASFLGFCGLSIPNFLPEVLPAVEIGWRLKRDAWGQGFATEAAHAAMAFGFNDIALDEIVSIHQAGNNASKNVMIKLGMQFDRETIAPVYEKPVHVYRKQNR